MTREDIIRMAREAGMERIVAIGIDGTQTVEIPRFDLLERFAALVAAEEREACAQVADEWQTAIHDPRYECDCATAIRARGEA